jgi:hypothetical protein
MDTLNTNKSFGCFGCKFSHPVFHNTYIRINCDKLGLKDTVERFTCPDEERAILPLPYIFSGV